LLAPVELAPSELARRSALLRTTLQLLERLGTEADFAAQTVRRIYDVSLNRWEEIQAR
jgi:hypothetical protein